MKSMRRRAAVWLACALVAGCAAPAIDRALLNETGADLRNQGVTESYRIHCPDVVELAVPGHPSWQTPRRLLVGPDGRVDLGAYGRIRIEELRPAEAAERLAAALGVGLAEVQVRVVEFNSQKVYVFGQVNGLERAVPYEGQETIVDLLQRVGGITSGARPDDIYLVRSNVADGKRPEIFPVKLEEILMNEDQRTNLRVEPFDKIYIGETRQSSLEKCVPPCLRPLYERCCGLGRRRQSSIQASGDGRLDQAAK